MKTKGPKVIRPWEGSVSVKGASFQACPNIFGSSTHFHEGRSVALGTWHKTGKNAKGSFWVSLSIKSPVVGLSQLATKSIRPLQIGFSLSNFAFSTYIGQQGFILKVATPWTFLVVTQYLCNGCCVNPNSFPAMGSHSSSHLRSPSFTAPALSLFRSTGSPPKTSVNIL